MPMDLQMAFARGSFALPLNIFTRWLFPGCNSFCFSLVQAISGKFRLKNENRRYRRKNRATTVTTKKLDASGIRAWLLKVGSLFGDFRLKF
jgi:hypothetical protein